MPHIEPINLSDIANSIAGEQTQQSQQAQPAPEFPPENKLNEAQQIMEQYKPTPGIQFGNSIDRATTEVTDLPSKFIPYPDNAKIYYRPYTYKDLDDFNDSNVDLLARLRFILEGIKTRGMLKENITLGDFLFIALYRRISSLGTTRFQIKIERPDFVTSVSFSFENIEFDDLQVPMLPVIAEVSGVECHFNPLTIGQFLELLSKEIMPGHKDYERACLAAQISNMDFSTAYNLVNNAVGQDLVILNEVDKLLYHSTLPLSVSYNYKGEIVHEKVALDDPMTLIFPYCGPDDLKRNPIRFGV